MRGKWIAVIERNACSKHPTPDGSAGQSRGDSHRLQLAGKARQMTNPTRHVVTTGE